MKFAADKEIESLLPAHDERTTAALTAKLKAEGCREQLTAGTYPGLPAPVLIDGYNRRAICRRLRIPYSVGKTIRFPNRDAMLQWVIDNQLARRNLTPEQVAYYRGRDYLHAKQPHGDMVRINTPPASGQSDHLGEEPTKTAETVAEKHGVGERTIRRDAEFAAAVDEIGAAEPEKKAAILNGTAGISKRQVVALVKPDAPAKTTEEKKARADYFRGAKDDAAEHEYAKLLNACKAFAVQVSKAVNESEPGSRLRDYLVYCGIVRPRDMVVDGKHYGWQCTYLRPLYKLINLAGKKRRLSKEQVKAAFQEALKGE